MVVTGAELHTGAVTVDERQRAALLAATERADLARTACTAAGAAVVRILRQDHALGTTAHVAVAAARSVCALPCNRVDEDRLAAHREHEPRACHEQERSHARALAHGETSTPSAKIIASGPTLADSRPRVRNVCLGASSHRSASARAAIHGAARYLAERPT